jgi:alpha-D-ribose 1-methylphosphonate 5-triphosphate synthase subunit PhnI
MAYVAVKGGKKAIEASLERLKYERLKKGEILRVGVVQAGLRSLIEQVMSEASLYNEEVAAVAVKQAEGSPEEAVFLLRAFRSTLPRKHYSLTLDSAAMRVERRISSAFKEIPGGQILGSSPDYSHRLIDFSLAGESPGDAVSWMKRFLADSPAPAVLGLLPKVVDYLRGEGLLRTHPFNDEEPGDVTKKGLQFPARRSERLQILTRGQTGAVTALGYASLRGYGQLHPTVGELRVGTLDVFIPNPLPENGADTEQDAYYVGEIRITEVESIIPKSVPLGLGKSKIEFEIGYGVCFGQNETKAIAMSILDQCLETKDPAFPTNNEEFVLMHIDAVEATGFISHLKLPHYVTFQSKLDSVRKIREEQEEE